MANLFSTLANASSITVLVDGTPRPEGFRVVGPGLLGKEFFTSPALTQEILDSPEFDQLLSTDKAQRVLEMVLKSIEHYTPS
ncbi:hypothetical protein [Hymenobacter frigidus]|uniref:hypothetical protein n=1 Tax=Hymenobacter frigidus TaxID=1524095 RepID=UPI001668A512|nr:hypothetical protein [Hymenobacter frigidus]